LKDPAPHPPPGNEPQVAYVQADAVAVALD